MFSGRAGLLFPFAILLALVFTAGAADFGAAMKLYQDGNYDAAAEAFTTLAREGHADAQFVLADMYRNGQGVGKDPVQAYKWYDLAARNGAQGAAEARDDLAGQMSPEDLAEAQKLAHEGQPSPASTAPDPTASAPAASGDGHPPQASSGQAEPPAPPSRSGFFPNLARSVSSLLSGPHSAGTETGSSTATIGIRGLGAEELHAANPDPAALQKMESYGTGRDDAASFARDAKLVAQSVAYIEPPASEMPPPASAPVPFGAR